MEKENQRIALSRRLLREGLMKLLEEKHIREISVKQLCEVSGINRTTFYRYYQTPHDVLLEIEIAFVKQAQEKPLPSTATSDIQQHAVYLCRFLYENRDMMRLFLRNSTESDIPLIFQNYIDSCLGSKKLLYKGHSIGRDTLRLMNTFFSHGVCAILRQWILEDIPLTPEEVADLIAGSFNQDFSFQ